MAAQGELHCMDLPGFWMDVGQPRDFITGTSLYLDSLAKKEPARLAKGPWVTGNVLVDPTAKIGEGCKVGFLGLPKSCAMI